MTIYIVNAENVSLYPTALNHKSLISRGFTRFSEFDRLILLFFGIDLPFCSLPRGSVFL